MPDKEFYALENAICPTMKKITMENVVKCLEKMEPQVIINKEIIKKARIPLERMIEIGR